MSGFNGGPAFPRSGRYHPDAPSSMDSIEQDGMTLRDYFAAAALTGYCGLQSAFEQATAGGRSESEAFARWAYAQADAMLAERDR